MKVIKSLSEIQNNQKIGLTIGNFDGVHLGHCHLLSSVRKQCQEHHLLFVVMTFVPHPKEILSPEGLQGKLLTLYEERQRLLSNQGVDYLVEVDFTRDFSTLNASNFVANFILPFNISHVFVGHDFGFGPNKEAGYTFLANNFADRFALSRFEPFYYEGQIISSSLIRKLLLNGHAKKGIEYLGRPYSLAGKIIKGKQMGRTIGVPTANLYFDRVKIVPEKGVYATKTLHGSQEYFSVTNVGNNPTFNIKNATSVETHLLDFNQDIYGEEIEVFFYEKIRNETRFLNLSDLKKQIDQDIIKVKSIFHL